MIQKLLLIVLFGIMTLYAKYNRSAELEKLSHDIYMKPYTILNSVQQKYIDAQLAKHDRVYEMAMENNVTTMKAYKERMEKAERYIAMNVYLASVRDSIEIRKSEVETYYKQHLRDYTMVHAYTMTAKKKEVLLLLLKQLATAKDKLTTFETLAKKYSQHPSAKKGGDMGFVGYDTIVQPFGKNTFELKEKSYTKIPFKTTLGWHIVYCKETKITPLKDVEKNIEYRLRMDKYKKWFMGI